MGYRQDRAWSDRYLGQIVEILRENAGALLSIQVAPESDDRKHATDLVVTVKGGDVAVRVRRGNCKYRDLTLRAMRDSHVPTELQKIKDGYARWYLYGWIKHDELDEWMLIDLDKLRSSGLLEQQRIISNYDGTHFIALSRVALRDCIIVERRVMYND